MSVVIETTIGDFTVDLFTEERPRTCMNFLKLCKMKYYNLNLLFSVQRNFIAQTGDPTGTGRGGESIYERLYGEQARFYEGEKLPIMRHTDPGTVSMVSCGKHMFGSQFLITLGEHLDSLDSEHLVFGQIVSNAEFVDQLNTTLSDDNNRPYQDIRITHTVVIHDPYPDPDGLKDPRSSPIPTKQMLESNYIGADENIDDDEGKSMEQVKEDIASKEAEARATILEIVGDIPDAEVAPPENVLFVCKLNPVTTTEDLEIIFSRFGKINSCEVIKDRITNNSLQYAFIEFDQRKSCEDAYFKMDNVLIDERRIHVDFSQSVSKIAWKGKGRIEYFDDAGKKVDGKNKKTFNPNSENVQKRNQSQGMGNYNRTPQSKEHRRDDFKHNNTGRDNSKQHEDKHKHYNNEQQGHHDHKQMGRDESNTSYNKKRNSVNRHRERGDNYNRNDYSRSSSEEPDSLTVSELLTNISEISESRSKVMKQLKKEILNKKKHLNSSSDSNSKKKHKKKKRKEKRSKEYTSDSDSEEVTPKKKRKKHANDDEKKRKKKKKKEKKRKHKSPSHDSSESSH